jgi:hypothetical protein
MTNQTIYRKAQELPFAKFCKWYNAAVRKRKNRDSNNASNEPSSVIECNEVGRTQTVVRKLTGESLPIYEDNN